MSNPTKETKIRVNVTFTAYVRYRKVIEMTQAEYDDYDKQLDEAEEDGGAAISRMHEHLFTVLNFDRESGDFDDVELDTFEKAKK